MIRDELSARGLGERTRKRPTGLAAEDELTLDELCERAGITHALARELEDYGLLEPLTSRGEKRYGESDADIAVACSELSRYGIAPRHLRTFRAAADRERNLLEQLVAPSLRSRNPERRKAGIEDLQRLAALAQELSQLLFWRSLRRLASS